MIAIVISEDPRVVLQAPSARIDMGLRDASSQGAAFSAYQQQLATELDQLQKEPAAGANPQPARP